jgi:hypothetical protein
MSDRVKVVGYAQRVFFNDGIEYRNFTDDLVGNQLVQGDDGISSISTFGNFVTRINNRGRASRLYSSKKFTQFYSLETLNLSESEAKSIINDNLTVKLNLDTANLSNFAYFGSTREFVRVSLENIISNWPASLYVSPNRVNTSTSIVGDTVINYNFDYVTNSSTFDVPTNFIRNNFGINYLKNGTTIDSFNTENNLKNLTVNFLDYVVFIDDTEYKVLSFSAATTEINDTITLKVNGDPFTKYKSKKIEYHIKPNSILVEKFFNSLGSFENNLLNRLTSPKYTSTYDIKQQTELGRIINAKKTVTWPVSDGYNIDFNTGEYLNYVNNLIDIADAKDELESNLIVRFLVAESISDFDTVATANTSVDEESSQKINKTLKIYGREFDEIKKHIDGISYANRVSYDKKNNTPDQLVKYLARVLGWGLTSSILDTDLISNYEKLNPQTYAGYNRGLTAGEAELELWRRLILNSAFIWKSKGTRKAIEFFFKLIGTPDGLINFNEYIYKAKEPIDMDLFFTVLERNGLDTDLDLYNVDSDGFPKFFRDTAALYFQKGGGWYRQTAGSGATQYVLEGNNPHVGPYDGGKEYINQLENIIPNFTPFTITSTTVSNTEKNVFTNYNNGVMNDYNGNLYIDVQSESGFDLSEFVVLDNDIITDPCPILEETDCGCTVEEDDEALIIDVTKCEDEPISISQKCLDKIDSYNININDLHYIWFYKVYDINGNPINQTKASPFISRECCREIGKGESFFYEEFDKTITFNQEGEEIIDFDFKNAGYICCPKNLKGKKGVSELGTISENDKKDGCGCKISCNWRVSNTPQTINLTFNITTPQGGLAQETKEFIVFVDERDNLRVVNEADYCFCPDVYTEPEFITDPYTGKQGFGCSLTKKGKKDITKKPDNSYLKTLYLQRTRGEIPCTSETLFS